MGNGVSLSLHAQPGLPECLLDCVDAQANGSQLTRHLPGDVVLPHAGQTAEND
jgi:hypothetical protein